MTSTFDSRVTVALFDPTQLPTWTYAECALPSSSRGKRMSVVPFPTFADANSLRNPFKSHTFAVGTP